MTTDPGCQLDLRPASRRRLAEDVATSLAAEIRDRRLAAGARMPSERELTSSLEVGRSTIREALKQLEARGLVEIRHGKGVFVTSPVEVQMSVAGSTLAAALLAGETADLLEARRPVEIMSARLGAARRTAADLKVLRARLRTHRRELDTERPVTRSSAEFHAELAACSHNAVLVAMVSALLPMFEERGPILEALPGYREWEYSDHTRLTEAIESADSDRAAATMSEHLDAVRELFERCEGG